MKLLSVNLARSIWSCNVFEFNPKGKSLYPVAPSLVGLYKFKSFPPPAQIPEFAKGIKFQDGEFKNSEGEVINVTLTVHNNGLVVDTRSSTKDSDAFLTEMLNRLSKEFGLLNHEQIISRKMYLSNLYVTIDKSLELINPRLKEISKYLSDTFSYPFEAATLHFWPEQFANQPRFVFERQANVPFAENKYYSSAPLQTDQHLELLNKFEDILSSS
jgi:hypothetical protein